MVTEASKAGIRSIEVEQRNTSGRRLYKTVEVFYTIQGEGDHVGEAAVFVRFSHCNLACTFCDTQYDAGGWRTADKLVQEANETWHDLRITSMPIVVFTGGEPSLQVDEEIVGAFQKVGYRMTMETNGLVWKPIMAAFETITVSPKTKNGWWTQPNDKHLRRFMSVKVVFDPTNPYLVEIMERARRSHYRQLYLQPLEDQATKATNVKEVIAFVQQNPEWKLSLQTHKLLGLR